jgi:hypothetical protein
MFKLPTLCTKKVKILLVLPMLKHGKFFSIIPFEKVDCPEEIDVRSSLREDKLKKL